MQAFGGMPSPAAGNPFTGTRTSPGKAYKMRAGLGRGLVSPDAGAEPPSCA